MLALLLGLISGRLLVLMRALLGAGLRADNFAGIHLAQRARTAVRGCGPVPDGLEGEGGSHVAHGRDVREDL